MKIYSSLLSFLIFFMTLPVLAVNHAGVVTQASGKHYQAKGSRCVFIINENASNDREKSAFLVFGQNGEYGEILDLKKIGSARIERLAGYQFSMDKVTPFNFQTRYGQVLAKENKSHIVRFAHDENQNETIRIKLKNFMTSESLLADIPGYYDLTCDITIVKPAP